MFWGSRTSFSGASVLGFRDLKKTLELALSIATSDRLSPNLLRTISRFLPVCLAAGRPALSSCLPGQESKTAILRPLCRFSQWQGIVHSS